MVLPPFSVHGLLLGTRCTQPVPCLCYNYNIVLPCRLWAFVSAVITPPDVFSLFLVVVPLYSLYEVSILLAARVERAKAREEVEAGSKVE